MCALAIPRCAPPRHEAREGAWELFFAEFPENDTFPGVVDRREIENNQVPKFSLACVVDVLSKVDV